MNDKNLAKLLLKSDMALFNSSHEDLVKLEEEQGRNFDDTYKSTVNLLQQTIKSFKKQRLQNIKQELAHLKETKCPRGDRIPQDPRERRSLFEKILATFPTMQPALTFQNRDLKSISDNDIEIALKQFEELGAIQDFENKK